TRGQSAGLVSRSSLLIASSCSQAQRLIFPSTKPSVWTMPRSPLLRKSPILISQPQLLRVLSERRVSAGEIPPHLRVARRGIHEDEIALLEAPGGRDVAHRHVEHPGVAQVAEIDTHPFERVLAENE